MTARQQATRVQRGLAISSQAASLPQEACKITATSSCSAKGYLKGGDFLKLLNASGCNFVATITPGTPDTITFTSGTAALKVYPITDAAPSNAIFCRSHNYDYDTALANGTIPYGTNGFIVVQKGGSAAVFKEGQATAAGWQGNGTIFQTQVGLKCSQDSTCDTTGSSDGGRSRRHVDL